MGKVIGLALCIIITGCRSEPAPIAGYPVGTEPVSTITETEIIIDTEYDFIAVPDKRTITRTYTNLELVCPEGFEKWYVTNTWAFLGDNTATISTTLPSKGYPICLTRETLSELAKVYADYLKSYDSSGK